MNAGRPETVLRTFRPGAERVVLWWGRVGWECSAVSAGRPDASTPTRSGIGEQLDRSRRWHAPGPGVVAAAVHSPSSGQGAVDGSKVVEGSGHLTGSRRDSPPGTLKTVPRRLPSTLLDAAGYEKFDVEHRVAVGRTYDRRPAEVGSAGIDTVDRVRARQPVRGVHRGRKVAGQGARIEEGGAKHDDHHPPEVLHPSKVSGRPEGARRDTRPCGERLPDRRPRVLIQLLTTRDSDTRPQ